MSNTCILNDGGITHKSTQNKFLGGKKPSRILQWFVVLQSSTLSDKILFLHIFMSFVGLASNMDTDFMENMQKV